MINLDKCIAFQVMGKKIHFEYDFVLEDDVCHTGIEFDTYEEANKAYLDILAGLKAKEKIVYL